MRADCGCGPTISLPLDQRRAAGIRLIGANVKTVADEVLVVDLLPPTPLVNAHWVVEHLCLTAVLTTRQPINGTPVCGLFLCPGGTPPVETGIQATAPPGLTLGARPIVLPVSERAIPSEQIPGAGWVLNITMQPGFKATVPGLWFLRAILNCAPATLTPGPGAGSIGILQATVVVEKDAA